MILVIHSFFFLQFVVSNFGFHCAAAILPVVQKQHQLLVTLLLCNACAMEVFAICLLEIQIPTEMWLTI